MTDFDAELVWAAQRLQTQRVVTRFLKALGFTAADWPYVPPIRQFLEMSAIAELAADMPELEDRAAHREAAKLLGMEDDDDRDSEYHPAERFRHAVNEWKRAAKKAGRIPPRTLSDAV